MGHKQYESITNFFDTTLLGILVGIISGEAVNVATGSDSNFWHYLSIAANSVSVIAIIKLIKLRMDIDEEVVKRAGIKEAIEAKWSKSVDYAANKERFKDYRANFYFFIVTAVAGIAFIIAGNHANTSKSNLITEQENIIRQLRSDSIRLEHQSKIFSDSLQTIKADTSGKTKTITTVEKSKAVKTNRHN